MSNRRRQREKEMNSDGPKTQPYTTSLDRIKLEIPLTLLFRGNASEVAQPRREYERFKVGYQTQIRDWTSLSRLPPRESLEKFLNSFKLSCKSGNRCSQPVGEENAAEA